MPRLDMLDWHPLRAWRLRHCKHPNRKEIDFPSHPDFLLQMSVNSYSFRDTVMAISPTSICNWESSWFSCGPKPHLRTHPKAEDIEQVGNPFEPFASIRYRPSKLEKGKKKQVSHYCWWFKIRRSPVEVGSLSHDFRFCIICQVVAWDFFYQQYDDSYTDDSWRATYCSTKWTQTSHKRIRWLHL